MEYPDSDEMGLGTPSVAPAPLIGINTVQPHPSGDLARPDPDYPMGYPDSGEMGLGTPSVAPVPLIGINTVQPHPSDAIPAPALIPSDIDTVPDVEPTLLSLSAPPPVGAVASLGGVVPDTGALGVSPQPPPPWLPSHESPPRPQSPQSPVSCPECHRPDGLCAGAVGGGCGMRPLSPAAAAACFGPIAECCQGFPQHVGSQCEGCGACVPAPLATSGALIHPLASPVATGERLDWGSPISFDTWPPGGAIRSAMGTHSWAYMPLISDALQLGMFPDMPRPAGLLANDFSWVDWVLLLRSGLAESGVNVLAGLVFDARCHLPRGVQEDLLGLAARHVPGEVPVSEGGLSGQPWIYSFAEYVMGVQSAFLRDRQHSGQGTDVPVAGPLGDSLVNPGVGGYASVLDPEGILMDSDDYGGLSDDGDYGEPSVYVPNLRAATDRLLAGSQFSSDAERAIAWRSHCVSVAEVAGSPAVCGPAADACCPVCLEEYVSSEGGDAAWLTTGCCNMWCHQGCLAQSLIRSGPACPNCRALLLCRDATNRAIDDANAAAERQASYRRSSTEAMVESLRPLADCPVCASDTACAVCGRGVLGIGQLTACCDAPLHWCCAPEVGPVSSPDGALVLGGWCPRCRVCCVCDRREGSQGAWTHCTVCSRALHSGCAASMGTTGGVCPPCSGLPPSDDGSGHPGSSPGVGGGVPCAASEGGESQVASLALGEGAPVGQQPGLEGGADVVAPAALRSGVLPRGAASTRHLERILSEGGVISATNVLVSAGEIADMRRRYLSGRRPAVYSVATHGPRVGCPHAGCAFEHGAAAVARHLRVEHTAYSLALPDHLLEGLGLVRCGQCATGLPFTPNGLRSHLRSAHPDRSSGVVQGIDVIVSPPAAPEPVPGPAGPGLIGQAAWDWLGRLSLDELFTSVSRSRRVIPKDLRPLQAQCQSLFRVAQVSESEATRDLGHKLGFLFGVAVLTGPSRGGASGARALKVRLKAFMRGDWSQLWAARLRPTERVRASLRERGVGDAIAKATKLYTAGYVSRAMKALNIAVPAPSNAETLQSLHDLHPVGPNPVVPGLPDDFEPLEVEREVVVKVIKSAPSQSAPGPDGIRYEHLKTEFEFGDSEALIEAVIAVAAGHLPPLACLIHAACRLLAFLKPNGKIRPIGVGNTLRRMGSGAIMSSLGVSLQLFFSVERACQFAVRTPSGLECALHLVRALLEHHPASALVSCDVINAFNELDRQAMVDALRAKFPSVLPHVLQFYSTPGSLLHVLDAPWPGDIPLPEGMSLVDDDRMIVRVLSAAGVTQGDGMGTFLFCLTIQSALDAAAAANDLADVLGWADDVFVCGPVEHALDSFEVLARGLGGMGLTLKLSACKIYSKVALPQSSLARVARLGLTVVPPEEGVLIFKSPVGSDEWCRQYIVESCESRRVPLALIGVMPHGAVQDGLLRYCAANWLLFLPRTCPPNLVQDLAIHDDGISFLSGRGVGVDYMGEHAEAVSQLPLAWGGMGLEPMVTVSSRAYVGGWLAAREPLSQLYPRFAAAYSSGAETHPGLAGALQTVRSDLERAQAFVSSVTSTDPPPSRSDHMRSLPHGQPIATLLEDARQVLNTCDVEHFAPVQHAQKRLAIAPRLMCWESALLTISEPQASILNGGSTLGSMTFLEPTPLAHLRLSPSNYMIIKQLHLGLPFTGLPNPEQCSVPGCHRVLSGDRDELLQHIVSHPHKLNHFLHAPVVRQVYQMARSQGHMAVMGEPPSVFGDRPHSADLVIRRLGGMYEDVRVDVKTCAEFGVSNLRTYGSAARALTSGREGSCVVQHDPVAVIPFVVTVAGQLGLEAERLIARVCGLSAGQQAGFDPSWTVPSLGKYWHRRLRCAAWAGTAALIRAAVGCDPVARTQERWDGAQAAGDLGLLVPVLEGRARDVLRRRCGV